MGSGLRATLVLACTTATTRAAVAAGRRQEPNSRGGLAGGSVWHEGIRAIHLCERDSALAPVQLESWGRRAERRLEAPDRGQADGRAVYQRRAPATERRGGRTGSRASAMAKLLSIICISIVLLFCIMRRLLISNVSNGSTK